ncbi:ABC transporter permease [Flavobacterium gawalongense]|uniref:Transport permease protein n=1 Tax=Flavobacterium gawalongense TaxID=2594432 RepID=A0A553BYW9_9FLAO|nr:ABC transporter permease [Flavobacterium gawalongense]TRX04532.1 ABC transporter permease [Flavobacterium gawalongense]TRX10419.1 ABC transporter permease [Flavobacterium gawalongense]TRX13467.1 ABC transporter permease [Flavobacterium gawalongense]TRX15601.1 ABC transporter permease [Flavobacterium gawalongense]TRX31439.1 ABC transporter permease [Flavobacterium gawalongense]
MSQPEHTNTTWLFEITPKNKFFSLNLKEVWQYRDLLMLFVKRDVVTVYKQTVLGPLWYLIQPLFTSITFTIIFNNVAGIDTGTVPPFLFNLAGITVWNYFTACLNDTSDTFKRNAAIFGKVYFPRIIMPLSIVISNLLKFGIQFLIFIAFYIYYYSQGAGISLNGTTLFFPLLIALMGILGLGLGMFISSLVTKYRDFSYLISFGVQLLMYVSAVMYPMALIKEKIPNYSWLVQYNPLAYVIETTRYMLLNVGHISISGLGYTFLVTVIVFFVGLLVFNKMEKSFIDTV